MINSYLKALAGFCFIAICSCSAPQPEQKEVPVNMIKAAKSITIELSALAYDYDPVCKMSLKSGVADTATVDGKLFGFCSEGCKNEFVLSHQQQD